MTKFDYLKSVFPCDWLTVFVGWRGVGVYSPWPNDWLRFPPLIVEGEILDFCDEHADLSDERMQIRIAALVEELCADNRSRASILEKLAALCEGRNQEKCDVEMRKWRCACMALIFEASNGDAFANIHAIEEVMVEFGSLQGAADKMRRQGWVSDACSHYDEDQCMARIREWRKWLDAEIASIPQ